MWCSDEDAERQWDLLPVLCSLNAMEHQYLVLSNRLLPVHRISGVACTVRDGSSMDRSMLSSSQELSIHSALMLTTEFVLQCSYVLTDDMMSRVVCPMVD